MGTIEWDSSKPAQSDRIQPYVLREQLAALFVQSRGINLLGDPTCICWPKAGGAQNQQGYWQTLIGNSSRNTGNYLFDGMAALLQTTTLPGWFYQTCLDTTAATPYRGTYFGLGAWLKTSDANKARLRFYDGITATLSDYHTGGGDWEWISMYAQMGTTATGCQFGLQLGGSPSGTQNCYIDGATMIMGQIEPQNYIPAASRILEIPCKIVGNPVSTGAKMYPMHNKPFVVKSVYIHCVGTVSGTDLIVDVDKWTGSWNSMFANRPTVSVGDQCGHAEPDAATYRYRCCPPLDDFSGGVVSNESIRIIVDQAPSSGGRDPNVIMTCTTWDRPLDQHNAVDYP